MRKTERKKDTKKSTVSGENTTPKKKIPSALLFLAVWRRFAVHLLLLPAVSLFFSLWR